MDVLAHRGLIESRLSRKLIHIGVGPIFVLCWLMYPDAAISRWLAALVPLLVTAHPPEQSKLRQPTRYPS
jgi:phytol kinase